MTGIYAGIVLQDRNSVQKHALFYGRYFLCRTVYLEINAVHTFE